MAKFIFQKTLIIGVGLIRSSIARALRENNNSSEISIKTPKKTIWSHTNGQTKIQTYPPAPGEAQQYTRK